MLPRTMIAPRTTAAAAERPAILRTWRCRAGIQRDHAQNLDSLATLPDLAVDRGAFRRVLKSGFFQRGDVQEHIRRSVRRRYEPKTFFRIEPFDPPPELGAALALIGHFVHSTPCRPSGVFIAGSHFFLFGECEEASQKHGRWVAEKQGPAGRCKLKPLRSAGKWRPRRRMLLHLWIFDMTPNRLPKRSAP